MTQPDQSNPIDQPGQPGTQRWLKQFGGKLVRVRYRTNPSRRIRSTTVEIIVDEAFWDPEGYENYEEGMSNDRQFAE
jgi:hypothetical protein